ncbi:hypothetical protein [Paenibacillus sp. MDMC362]|uniref:hypothetical protein n=1 Tax=Paenibacillus sp. MDMC362 TaxID=2977365 RepID=UPI000DC37F35|nr:hypothetical protein [Paenibacillus sp. MDMC362]RAR44807.1 hypothetical protein DP091_06495 [Paenibacillus sp. MDMC362]
MDQLVIRGVSSAVFLDIRPFEQVLPDIEENLPLNRSLILEKASIEVFLSESYEEAAMYEV